MLILAKLIGVAIIAVGAITLISPQILKKHMDFCLKGKVLYIGSILRLIIGVFLILVSPKARIPGVVVILGGLAIIKGAAIFIVGIEKIESVMKWWQLRPDGILRLMALLAIAVGSLLVYSI